jgi:spermidine synthase
VRSVRLPALSALVFCSGCCALIYQIGWLRELRLVFGASTYASSAVLAIFMGGLGLGSAVLGRRADRHPQPLRLYAWLELGIAAGALLSPLLFLLIRKLYLAAGGASAMGQPLALAVRLALSCLVLGVPTFLMGGTLPAVVRAAGQAGDVYRRTVALLYGINTLGAVCGVLAATFLLLEHLGTRLTILSGAALNVAVALAAFALAARTPAAADGGVEGSVELQVPTREQRDAVSPDSPALPNAFILAAAALTGFCFFLMEIVWYRMLSPLLGGTTYTFGLILAVALAGIGSGGLLSFLLGRHVRPTARLFAATCGLEALGLALAFGLGDRLAVLAIALRPDDSGLAPLAAGWAVVTAIVVFPPALVAGFQFPLLIALLGRGRRDVGRHTGAVYAWNTGGSIAGALVGGFGLLPLLGAPRCWQLTVLLLGATCAAAMAVSLRREGGRLALALPAAALLGSFVLIAAPGPSAAWRHTPIGAGGVALEDTSRNSVRNWVNERRFGVVWEKDGLESSVAISRVNALAFVVNGKVDGNSRFDAGTQVMGPVVGAILHPGPSSALVIGLGTGSSAGWLAAIDTIKRVNVAELEPAVLEVARRCAPVNRGVLENPKVRIIPGDGRELLMTSQERYDLIFSEPSNPYRAGIAGLYTLEFYRALAERLAPGGIFSQWVQGYGVDPVTVRRVAATLASVFENVETWQTLPGDLLFVCSAGPKDYAVQRLAARVATEPFRSALLAGWGVEGLDGFLSGFFADDSFAKHALRLSAARGELNTDDLAPVEFGFARNVGNDLMSMDTFRLDTRARNAHRPDITGGEVDWDRVEAAQLLKNAWHGAEWPRRGDTVEEEIYKSFNQGGHEVALRAFREGRWRPAAPLERVMAALALARAGDNLALSLLPRIVGIWPATAAAVQAHLSWVQGDADKAFGFLSAAIAGFRTDPWNSLIVMRETLALGEEIAKRHPRLAGAVFELLDQPLSVRLLDQERISRLMNIAMTIDCRHAERVLSQIEPNVPWVRTLLEHRASCYEATGNPLAARARRELTEY